MRTGLRITYVGGPTALFEAGGVRLLTDPTFDPAGSEYKPQGYTLRKLQGPAIPAEALGKVDIVLLSHDHHYDNLDHSGREILGRAARVLTTPAAAGRLGGHSVGLADWQSIDIPVPGGRTLRIIGTPARHGAAGADRGPVTGFLLQFIDTPDSAIYLTGDTGWYEGIAEVSRRYRVATAVLFMGAARVQEVSPDYVTMTADDGIQAARAFSLAMIVPLHFEGWAHFSQSREDIQSAFAAAGLENRLRWPVAGSALSVD